jgi:hypothetical protein
MPYSPARSFLIPNGNRSSWSWYPQRSSERPGDDTRDERDDPTARCRISPNLLAIAGQFESEPKSLLPFRPKASGLPDATLPDPGSH